MGHEGAGVVEAVGEGVGRPSVGERVVVNYVNPDGTCPLCLRGREDLCERAPLGFGTDVVFAEAVAVEARNLVALPAAVPFEEGAVLGCAGATAFHATRRSGLGPGMSCMVVGLGGVGMQGVQVAKAFGASPLLAVDVSPTKLRLAQKFGADVAIDPGREDSVEVARSLGDGRGVDVAFEYIGLERTLGQAIGAARPGGLVMMVGIPGGAMTFDAQAFNLGGKGLQATQGHSGLDLQGVIQLRASGVLRTGETITHRLPFKDIGRAISLLESGKEDLVRVTLHH
jgi:threonine dehydrogenase-like Zn-dependent dehydrogenase